MKSCPVEGYPFVFGFTVFESFVSDQVAKTGIVNMPKPREQGHGWARGFGCDTKKRFMYETSGSDWGIKGYLTVPYDYLSRRDLSDDFWLIRVGD
jgi:hypothetical protein